MLFLASLFVVPQTIGAKGSDARIDGQYPMGVASDYMLVAGNRIRHSGGAQMSGRFMANSMAFDNSAGFNDTGIWNNSLNTYASDETPESVSDFYSNLWNPAVVINDFTKENSIKDPAFSNPVASLSTNIVGMWPHNRTSLPYEVLDPAKKRVRFITDTSKKEVEDSAGEQSKKMVDTAWANNLDTKTENGQAINGLSDLTQFKDNNITKYLTQNTAVAGRSVEDDIQDVSDFYNNLASGDSDATAFSSFG